MNQVDISVGRGDITYLGWITTAISWLTSVSTLITTMSDNLPAGLDPSVAVWLTIGSGALGFAIQGLVALSKVKFAQAKALVMAGQGAEAYDVLVDSIDVDPDDIPDIPTDPTDSNTPPPVEP